MDGMASRHALGHLRLYIYRFTIWGERLVGADGLDRSEIEYGRGRICRGGNVQK